MSELVIVVDVESEPPRLCGEYVPSSSYDEDVVFWKDDGGTVRFAPQDCVEVVRVQLKVAAMREP